MPCVKTEEGIVRKGMKVRIYAMDQRSDVVK